MSAMTMDCCMYHGSILTCLTLSISYEASRYGRFDAVDRCEDAIAELQKLRWHSESPTRRSYAPLVCHEPGGGKGGRGAEGECCGLCYVVGEEK